MRNSQLWQHQAGWELRRTICVTYVNCRVSAGSTTVNVVNDDEPKMLTGSDQKVRGKVSALRFRTAQPAIPPANRQTLRRHGQIMRNMVEPRIPPPQRGREPQGVPKGMRVRDVGESESRIVMMRTAAHAAARKDADFRQVADHGKDEERFCRRQHGQTPGLQADR